MNSLSEIIIEFFTTNYSVMYFFSLSETITAVFKTNLRTEFPFDAVELLVYAFIG